MTQSKALWLHAALVICLAVLLAAGTWRVEQDGGGDFSVLQNAVDAAAPGDTVLVGSGVYSEQSEREYAYGLFAPTLLDIPVQNLTIIGVDPDSVLLGEPATGCVVDYGIVCLPEAAGFNISGMSIVGAGEGARLLAPGVVKDLTISGCHLGIVAGESSLITVENCRVTTRSVGLLAFQMDSLRISTLSVHDGIIGLEIQSTRSAILNGVLIEESGLAMQLEFGSSATVERLLIRPSCGNGISLNDRSALTLIDSRISASETSVGVAGGSFLTARRAVFDSAGFVGLDFTAGSTAQVNQCNVLPVAPLAIRVRSYNGYPHPLTLDFRHVYWGTTERDAIAERIEDFTDDPSVLGIVDFEPPLDASVPIGRSTLGGLKALFGARD